MVCPFYSDIPALAFWQRNSTKNCGYFSLPALDKRPLPCYNEPKSRRKNAGIGKGEHRMIQKYTDGIKTQKTPRIERLKKKGTIKISAVEATPVVWKDRLLRFEWLRSSAWDTVHKQREVGSYQFFDMETEEPVGAEFAFDHAFGCCYAEDGVMYAHGVRGSDGATNVIDVFWSRDLTTWESHTALVLPDDLKVFNTSVSPGADGQYVMAIEISGPKESVGPGYKCIFALSKDLLSWELLPIDPYIYRKECYSACPAIRYFDGYYYMVYLDVMPYKRYVPYIVRSADLAAWEIAIRNPFMFFDDGDKQLICPERFSESEKQYIENAVDCNNSDVDFCEFHGKTYILYSWGNQHGQEFLALATYDGTLKEFLTSYF